MQITLYMQIHAKSRDEKNLLPLPTKPRSNQPLTNLCNEGWPGFLWLAWLSVAGLAFWVTVLDWPLKALKAEVIIIILNLKIRISVNIGNCRIQNRTG